jgi:acyl carrier protein
MPVAEVVEQILGRRLEDNEPLMEAGLDSIAASELVTGIWKATGVQLPVTTAFDFPSIEAVAQHVQTQIAGPRVVGKRLDADIVAITHTVERVLSQLLGVPVDANSQLMEVASCLLLSHFRVATQSGYMSCLFLFLLRLWGRG